MDKYFIEAKVSRMKNQEALSVVNDLLKLTRSILKECDKDPDLNDLAIKHLLNQKELLEKFRELENSKTNPSIKKFFEKWEK